MSYRQPILLRLERDRWRRRTRGVRILLGLLTSAGALGLLLHSCLGRF